MEYRRKAKLIPASSALADKQWKIVIKKEELIFNQLMPLLCRLKVSESAV
jgi:hypothetical protein